MSGSGLDAMSPGEVLDLAEQQHALRLDAEPQLPELSPDERDGFAA